MSRFDFDGDEAIPFDLWETIVSNALGGRKGQEALASMEEALLALPQPKLIDGHLACDGQVCAVGALVAHRRSKEQGIDLPAVIEMMGMGVTCGCGHARGLHDGVAGDGACGGKRPRDGSACYCTEYEPDVEDAFETAEAGQAIGLSYTVAYHLAYLNDEQFSRATPEERYDLMLAWVRRAQGKLDQVAA